MEQPLRGWVVCFAVVPITLRFLTPFRWFLTILSFAAAIGVSVYVIGSSWPAEGAPLGLPWWTHGLLLAAVGVDLVFRAYKVVFSARAVGSEATFRTGIRTALGGDFAASITPSRVGAEPARFLVLNESGVSAPHALLVIFLELTLEMASLGLLAGIAGLLWHEESRMVQGLLATVGIYTLGVLGAAVIAYWLARRSTGPVPAPVRWVGMNAGLWRRIQLSLRSFRGSIESLRHANVGQLLLAYLCSVGHVAARLVLLPVILHAYGGGAALSELVLWPMALLYGAAVAPVPGGGGVVELAYNAALGRTIPARLLGASLIWWRVYSFYIYLALGAVATGRTVMRALRNKNSDS